jgi:peroxiredoxin Q/BCP
MADRKIPEVGKKAPAFTLKDSDGTRHALKDYLGKQVVLYFYPKDNTSGCTTEACDFRDNMKRLAKHDTVVLGVSPDSEASHRKFSDKYELNFTLLADPDRQVLAKYGAYGEKTLYGKQVMGVIRSTFLIDEQGKIAHVWPKVRVKGHVDQVLEKLGV